MREISTRGMVEKEMEMKIEIRHSGGNREGSQREIDERARSKREGQIAVHDSSGPPIPCDRSARSEGKRTSGLLWLTSR